MKKELLSNQKEYLKNIEEIQDSHASVFYNHLYRPTLEKNTDVTPPRTALPTPNYMYQQRIKDTVIHKKQNIEIKKE